MSTSHKWEKEGYLWIKIDDDKRTYEDIIINTMSKIVEDDDVSEWALYSWFECAGLLMDKKRWPDEYKKDSEAPNRWVWIPYRFVVKTIFDMKMKWSRPQKSMTRDPHYAFGDCYVHLYGHYGELIDRFMTTLYHNIKLPWFVWRFNFYRWKRRLRKPHDKYFVSRLLPIKDKATHFWFEKNYENDFYENVPKTTNP